MSKTNTGLVAYAVSKIGLPYWYGTFGQIATETLHRSKKQQYPSYYTASDFPSQYGKQVFDCIGLIKAYLWCDSIDDTTPAYNSSEDWGADTTYARCVEKGAISTMPELPGALVFMSGHVGVYIGDGYVVEARGHNYGVVKTKLSARAWKTWGKHPLIDYGSGTSTTPVNTTNKTVKELTGVSNIKNGDKGYGVQILQANLAKLGYYTIAVDGIFGSGTLAAVKKFQFAYGLSVDGIVGKNTSAKLSNVIMG